MLGTDLPAIKTEIPGPHSQAWVDRLALRECPAITARRSRRAQSLGTASSDPIVWSEAIGSNVMDVDGNRFVDLTSGFGVAAAGHRANKVVDAAQRQSDRLIHAMGDAFPDPKRIELLERLCALSGMDRAILGCSGSDAIDAAIKTACLKTGKPKVLAFTKSYHGLASGSLPATHYKSSHFKHPFQEQLGNHVDHFPYGEALPKDIGEYGAIIVEPIQGRGGCNLPPKGWLDHLIKKGREANAMVIFDEIYTGFGRTGHWFGFQNPKLCQHTPDIICVGKAMGGGFPISACLGLAEAMDAWGASQGEAIHTQTFLGNPLGCAMALAAIDTIESLLPKVNSLGLYLKKGLENLGLTVRGQGLLLGIELPNAYPISQQLLQKGYIVLPAGESAEVLCLTPPFCLTEKQARGFMNTLGELCLN